jgi:hypothetical protein
MIPTETIWRGHWTHTRFRASGVRRVLRAAPQHLAGGQVRER